MSLELKYVNKEILTIKEVARLMGFHYLTVRKLINIGVLPRIKVGRMVRIHRSDLEKFLNEHREKQRREEGEGKK
jgi:excisionase family DNA binding protein